LSVGSHRTTEPPATRDHFIPLALGGRNHISNIVLSCRPCDQSKGDRFPSVEEISRWNDLAFYWPYIRMFRGCADSANKDRVAESHASDAPIMALASHLSRKMMMERYSHVREEAKRAAVSVLDQTPARPE
jgi:hypothetical protein